MEKSDDQVAGEILHLLQNPRDASSCQKGLSQLRSVLSTCTNAPGVLRCLMAQSPRLDLLAIWDSQTKSQDDHFVASLMLTIADVLSAASSVSGGDALEIKSAAAGLASAILSRRIKSIYSHLASQRHFRSTASLLLLASIASLGPFHARELVRTFDFTLSALPALARPPKGRKEESERQTIERYRREWVSPDPLKRPARAAFVSFTLALLRAADANLLPEVAALRAVVGGMLHRLAADPPQVQCEVLRVLQKRVLGAKATLGPAAKAVIFSDAAMGQLATICAQGEDEVDEEDGAEGGETGAPSEDEDEEEEKREAKRAKVEANGAASALRRASDLAFSILGALIVDPVHGLATSSETAAEHRTFLGAAGLSYGQRRLLRWLQRLRLSESALHGELLAASVQHDAALAAAFLLAPPFPLEPAPAGRWLVHAGAVGTLLQRVAATPVGLLELAERGLPPPEVSSRQMQAALQCCLPPSLPRAALSRGIQHENALVRHSSLCLLSHMLTALDALLQAAAAAEAALPATCVAPLRSQWQKVSTDVRQAARASLPDLQSVLAQLSALADPIRKGYESQNGTDSEATPHEEKILLLSAALHALQLWLRCFPAAPAESNFDLEKLAAGALPSLHPLLQMQVLAALEAAAAEGAATAVRRPGPGAGAAMPAMLRLLAGAERKQVKRAAAGWLAHRLSGTGLFEANPAEGVVWVDLLGTCSAAGAPEAAFFGDAVALVLRRPDEFFLSTGEERNVPEWSLLVLCVLRQAVRVLGSQKKDSEEKNAVARFAAAGAALVTLQQRSREGVGAAATALLRVLRSEATRRVPADAETAAAGSKGRKRKAADSGDAAGVSEMLESLGEEAEPVSQLFAWLQSLAKSSEREAARTAKIAKLGAGAALADQEPLDTMPWEQFAAVDSACEAAAGSCGPKTGEAALAFSSCVPASQLPLAFALLAWADSPFEIDAIHLAVTQRLAALAAREKAEAAVAVARQALALAELSLSSFAHVTRAAYAALQGALSAIAEAFQTEELSVEGALACLAVCCESQSLLAAALSDHNGEESDAIAAGTLPPSVQVVLQALQLAAAIAAKQGGSGGGDAAGRAVAAVVMRVGYAVNAAAQGNHMRSLPSSALLALLVAAAPLVADDKGAAENLAGAVGRLLARTAGAGVDAGWAAYCGRAAAALLQQLAAAVCPERDFLVERFAAAAKDLVASKQFSLAEAVLQGALSSNENSSTAASTVVSRLGDKTSPLLLRHCMGHPTPQRAALACRLLESSGAAVAWLREAINKKEISNLAAADDEGNTLGVLLPAFTVYLKQEIDAVAPADGAKCAASSILKALLRWAALPGGGSSSKNAAAAAEGITATQQQQQQRSSAAEVAECLALALALSEELPLPWVAQTLAELSPVEGWLPGKGSVSPVTGAATPVEKASIASALLRYARQQPNNPYCSAAALTPVARCFLSTLTAVLAFKRRLSSSSTSADLLPSSQELAALEACLLAHLDGEIGDAVAALPLFERRTPAFEALAGDFVCGRLGTAVLRHRAQDPRAMRVLRRFAAALLPGDEDDAADEEKHAAANNDKKNGGSTSSSSSSDSDDERDSAGGAREAAAPLKVPAIAAAAAELFQRAVTHSHFLSTMQSSAASPPALPDAAAKLPRPLESLLSTADIHLGGDPSTATEVEFVASFDAEIEEEECRAAKLKKELCELLETLLDVEERYGGSVAGLEAAEAALLPVAMAAYGGSLSAADVAVWGLARALNLRAWSREQHGSQEALAEGDVDSAALQALLEGPLAQTCFAWGPAAVAAAAAGLDASLQSKLPLDPPRCALTVTHFPEQRSLLGFDSFTSSPLSSSCEALSSIETASDSSARDSAAPPALPACPAAYDPAFLLPFCVAALRWKVVSPRSFVTLGLASVCLRAMAAEDPALRAVAFEALGLLTAQVQAPLPSSSAAAAIAAVPAAFGGDAGLQEDFRERAQLCSLLEWIRGGIQSPFTRLPAVHAAFAAEAAISLSHPATPMYAPVNKARLKTATIDFSIVPLLAQAMHAGGAEAAEERAWLLRLLLTGLRSSQDARLYLRQYVFEAAMALADSPVAAPSAASLALAVVCRAAQLPRAARGLCERSGMVGWLASRAARLISTAMRRSEARQSGTANAALLKDARGALEALHHLTSLRSVVGRSTGPGNPRAVEDFSTAMRGLLRVLCDASAAPAALSKREVDGMAAVWGAALRVAAWTATAGKSTGVKFLAVKEAQEVMGAAAGIGSRAGVDFSQAGRRLVAACP